MSKKVFAAKSYEFNHLHEGLEYQIQIGAEGERDWLRVVDRASGQQECRMSFRNQLELNLILENI